jgi:hypothetical protein
VIGGISLSDAQAYGTYGWYCGLAGVRPLPFLQWLLLTEIAVRVHWDDVKFRASYSPDNLSEQEEDDAPHLGPKRQEDHLVSKLVELGGFTFGVLRPDGTVAARGVRRQTSTRGGGVHFLTFRTCRHCNTFQPASRFSKQDKSIRAVCKACDSKKRVERRRVAKAAARTEPGNQPRKDMNNELPRSA